MNRLARTPRAHLLPFGGASLRQINRAAQPYTPAPEPLDTSAERALAWAKGRDARIAAARANRATPNGSLTGSRYAGGFSATARSR